MRMAWMLCRGALLTTVRVPVESRPCPPTPPFSANHGINRDIPVGQGHARTASARSDERRQPGASRPLGPPRGLCVGGLPVIARAVGSDRDPDADIVDMTTHSGIAQDGRAPENGLRGPRKGHQGSCYPGGVGPRGVVWRTGCGCTVTCPKRDLAEIATSGKRVVLKSPLPSVMRVRTPFPLPSLRQPGVRSLRSLRGSHRPAPIVP